MIGIYKITNSINQKSYIGSSVNIKERWRRHKKDLRKNKHHSIILQRAWNKYGESVFEFSILEICSVENLINKEDDYFISHEPVYNICKHAYSSLGVRQTEESKQKRRVYALTNNIKPPKETYEKQYISVIKVDKETNKDIATYESLSAACLSVGKTHHFVSTITKTCKGIRKSAFGYKWRFNNENIK